ncbi:hypothetical protein AX762_02010 [Alkalibacterium sp. 20]|nr:hypothetical protein AX762_02010 [Alkalibacterium sp. 20]
MMLSSVNLGILTGETDLSDAKKSQLRHTQRETDLSDAKKSQLRHTQRETGLSDANAVLIRRLGLINQLE